MIVYVLTHDLDYDGNDIQGVFATSELAKAASPGAWRGNDNTGYSRDAAKVEGFDMASITAWKVQR